jgi:hypothetical protein
MSSGYSQFLQKWGNRTLKDNWRASSRGGSILADNSQDSTTLSRNATAVLESAGTNPKKAEEKFLSIIPKNQKQIDSIQNRMILAHLANAEIFDLDLRDFPKSIDSYLKALNLKPDSTQKVQIYYDLYSLYSKLSEPTFNAQIMQDLQTQGAPTENLISLDLARQKTQEYRQKIILEFPKSNFATYFLNPEVLYADKKPDTLLENYYDSTYVQFLKHDYPLVLKSMTSIPIGKRGNYLESKFDFLKALSIGYTHPLPDFEIELKNLELKYPKDSIGQEAHRLLQSINQNRSEYALRPTALEFPKYDNGFELAQRLQDQRDAYIRQKKEEAEKARKSYYSLDFEPPFQFLILLKNPKVNLNTMRLNLSLFAQYNFPGLHLKNQMGSLNGNLPTMFITSFPNIRTAISYYQKFEEQKSDLVGLPPNQFEYYFISRLNFEKLKDTSTLNIYREFFNESMLPYTSTVAPRPLPDEMNPIKSGENQIQKPKDNRIPTKFSFVKTGNFLVTAIIKNTRANLSSVRLKLSLYNQANYGDKNLRLASNFIEKEFQSLAIGYFPNLESAMAYYHQLEKNKEDIFPVSPGDVDILVISPENLQKIKTRDIESDYLSFFDKNIKTP